MNKYFIKIINKEIMILDMDLNTIDKDCVKISDEVCDYLLKNMLKLELIKNIDLKEIKNIEELKPYFKEKHEEKITHVIDRKPNVSIKEVKMLKIIEMLGFKISQLEDKVKDLEKKEVK